MAGSVKGRRLSALVLAAGDSSRMPGRSKLERAWGKTTVLGAVLDAAREARLEPIVVVVRRDSAPPPESAGLACVHVTEPGEGRATSLATGLRALPDGPVVILLGDEPGIRSSDIRHLVRSWRESGTDMARLRYDDRPGHPVLLGPGARAAADGLRGEPAIWEGLVASGLAAIEVRVDGPAPIDVDSPEDLRRARRLRSRSAGR